MGKFEEKIALYEGEMTKLGINIDSDLLLKVTRGCGPSIYNLDAEKVSSSDKAELDRVKQNFLIKKMGMTDGPTLDNAISKTVETFGAGNKNKYRPIFYYLLVKELGLASKYE